MDRSFIPAGSEPGAMSAWMGNCRSEPLIYTENMTVGYDGKAAYPGYPAFFGNRPDSDAYRPKRSREIHDFKESHPAAEAGGGSGFSWIRNPWKK